MEGAWVVPVFAADIALVLRTADIDDDTEETVRRRVSESALKIMGNLGWFEAGTYMKPTTAVTLMRAKTNSASPYPLTPKRLIVIVTTRKMVTNMALSIWAFQ